MWTKYKTLLVCVLAFAVVGLAGCVPSYSINSHKTIDFTKIQAPVGSNALDPDQVNMLLTDIEERNKTVEEDPEWIRRAYSGLMVRKLNNIRVSEYKKYRKYLDNGAAYIIVHPAFFPFFHFPGKLPLVEGDTFVPKHNVVERLLNLPPPDEKFALLQAQERRMRDFLEFMSERKKLVIVVVPRHYDRYKGYKYRKDNDEYTRYLNEVTNFSESVIFAESRSPNRGYLTDEDGIRLMEFLLSVDAKTIYLGGGYIGRCLEDFYKLLTDEFGPEDIYVVPELSDVSPREINSKMAKYLLLPNGEINEAAATDNLVNDVYHIQETKPSIRHLPGEEEKIEAQEELLK
jgi:hypothetical protein